MRGRAAIVGVTDAVSPTGELALTGRALEAQVVREALDDAGLTLADVDGICHMGAMAFAEYLGIHPRFVDCCKGEILNHRKSPGFQCRIRASGEKRHEV